MFKQIFAILLAFALSLGMIVTANFANAAGSGWAVKFEIQAPATAKVGEAIDVSVRALDKDNKTATEYRGSIIFMTEWLGDIVPMPGRSIAFTAEDQGQKKFSKGVTFKKAGKNKLTVQDLEGDVAWEITVTVEEGGTTATTTNEEVSIITPENNAKIATNSVMVSGKARKNSKVSLTLNGTDIGSVVSDDSGIFTKEIQNITQDTNILKASVLDANNQVIGSSSDVTFMKSGTTGGIYALTISPSNTVEASTGITLNVEAEKGLSNMTVMLDWTALALKEISEGKYSASTTAPQKEGSYPLSVSAKNATAQTVSKDAIATLTVTAKTVAPTQTAPVVTTPAFKNIKAETSDAKVQFTFAVENAPTTLDSFKITYGQTGTVNTSKASKIYKDGVYAWYIDKLSPGDYTFKIQGIDASGSVITGLISDPIMATVGVKSCSVSNVGKINIATDTSKSILSWESVPGATGYNVYRIGSDGKYSLIQHTKDPSYTIFLSKWAVTFGDFWVKATCGDNTESLNYSNAAKVQTGPGMIAFAVIFSAIVGALFLRKRV